MGGGREEEKDGRDLSNPRQIFYSKNHVLAKFPRIPPDPAAISSESSIHTAGGTEQLSM